MECELSGPSRLKHTPVLGCGTGLAPAPNQRKMACLILVSSIEDRQT